jgi:TonB family protein
MLALLAESALRVSVLGAVAWLCMRSLRLRNPHVEKLVSRLVLVAGLVLPALVYFRLAPVFDLPASLPTLAVTGLSGAPAPAAGLRLAPLMIVLTTIYLGVAAILLTAFVAGIVRMGRLCRAAQPLPAADDLRASACIQSPATFGSTVLVPEAARNWSFADLDAVLTHERAHVRWRDCHWQWLAQLHQVVFWFSPFAWWLRHRLAVLAEATSDDAVLSAGHDPVAYAELLLAFARHPDRRRVAISASGPEISSRIERILSRAPPSRPLRRITGILAAALLIPATLFAAASASSAGAPVYRETNGGKDGGPYIVDFGDLAKAGEHYPPLAAQNGIAGKVTVGATIDSVGRVVDVKALAEQPDDPQYGFGATALDLARTVRFANPGKKTSYVKFQVKFTLED